MRVLKDNGTMYFMTATQHMPYLDVYVSENYNVLCRIVWSYDRELISEFSKDLNRHFSKDI